MLEVSMQQVLKRRLALQVRPTGIIVFVPQYGIEGPAKMPESLTEATLIFNEEKQHVLGPDGSIIFTIFDSIQIRATVEETQGHRRHLALTLVDERLEHLKPSNS